MWKTNVGDIVTSAQFNTLPRVYYRKTTAKNVISVSETDLLNGEVTITGGDMGTTGMVRITCWGQLIQATGAAKDHPRFKVKLGSGPTTALDTNVATGLGFSSSGSGYGWRAVIEILNLNATNSQITNLNMVVTGLANTTPGNVATYTTGLGATQLYGDMMTSEGVNTTAIDTTANMAVQFTTTNPTATNYEVDLYAAIVELV